ADIGVGQDGEVVVEADLDSPTDERDLAVLGQEPAGLVVGVPDHAARRVGDAVAGLVVGACGGAFESGQSLYFDAALGAGGHGEFGEFALAFAQFGEAPHGVAVGVGDATRIVGPGVVEFVQARF